MRLFYWLFIAVFSISACKCDKNQPKTPEKLPESPQEVLLVWQSAQDKKQFDLARQLSTERTRKFIDLYAKIATDPELSEHSVPQTVLQNLVCRQKNDTCAICSFFTVEEGEQYNDSLILVKIKGQWLVDLPDDDSGLDLNDSLPEADTEKLNQ